jgi:hypothetical protein
MQCEEDWLVMHVLHAHHGWSISKIAREFGVNWRTAHRYANCGLRPGRGTRWRHLGRAKAESNAVGSSAGSSTSMRSLRDDEVFVPDGRARRARPIWTFHPAHDFRNEEGA